MSLERQLKNLPINDVYLSDDNPRINTTVRQMQSSTDSFNPGSDRDRDQMLLSRFLVKPATKKLELDIIKAGGIQTPVDVEVVDGRYVVFEGNTRTAIYKKLYAEDKQTWAEIPAFIYPNITLIEKKLMLNREHPQGKRQWDPYETAQEWKKQKEIGIDLNTISRSSGKSELDVERAINTINLMDKHYKPYLLEAGETIDDHKGKYNHFLQILISDKQKKALEKHNINIKEYSKLVFEERIKEARDVRKLDEILDNPKAKKIFLNPKNPEGASKEALKVTVHPKEEEVMSDMEIHRVITHLLSKILSMTGEDIQVLGKGDYDIMLRLITELKLLREHRDELDAQDNNGENQ